MYTIHFLHVLIHIIYTNTPSCSSVNVNIACLAFHSPKMGVKRLVSSLPQMEPMPKRSLEVEKGDSTKQQVHSDFLVHKLRETAASIREQTKASESNKEEREKETTSWLVILHNDDIHSFQFVTEALAQCIPHLSLAKAHTITVQAHSDGQATVLATWRDRANMYCESLQRHGLTVSTMHTNQNGN